MAYQALQGALNQIAGTTGLAADAAANAAIARVGTIEGQHGTLISGEYYYHASPASQTTKTGTLNAAYVTPLYIPNTVTISKIALEQTAAGAATSVCRVGIWSDATTGGFPGALLLECGTIDTTGANGVKELTISQALPKGLYWVGAVSQGATFTWRSCQTPAATTFLFRQGTSLPAANDSGGAYFQTGMSAGLVAWTSASSNHVSVTDAPRLIFKVT